MSTVKKGTELVITLGDNIGAGADLFGLFKTANVNVVASSCFQIGGEVTFTIVPDNLERALQVLEEEGLTPEPKDVLLVQMDNRPGALADLLKSIAEMGISVRSAYATTSSQATALAILETENDEKVLERMGTDS